MPKTGTTALQRFLSLNRERLAADGLVYPESRIYSRYQHKSLAMQADWKFRPFRNRAEQAALDAEVSRLRAEIASCPSGARVILSSEWLYGASPKRVARFCPPGETQVVVYLRDQVNYLSSYYQEVVALFPVTERFDRFVLRERNLNYLTKLKAWEKVFGKEHLTVRNYRIDRLYQQGIVPDFLQAVGVEIEPERYNFRTGSSNPSVGGELLEFKRLLNGVLDQPRQQRDVLRHPIKDLARRRPEFQQKPALRDDVKERLIAKYAPSNRQVFAEYMNSEDGFSYELRNAAAMPELTPQRFFEIAAEWRAFDKTSHDYAAEKIFHHAVAGRYGPLAKLKSLFTYV